MFYNFSWCVILIGFILTIIGYYENQLRQQNQKTVYKFIEQWDTERHSHQYDEEDVYNAHAAMFQDLSFFS